MPLRRERTIMRNSEMTFEEKLTLYLLADRDQQDDDTKADRVLINTGLAERYDPGMMRITPAGTAALMAFRHEIAK
jgi:hypothetical protein